VNKQIPIDLKIAGIKANIPTYQVAWQVNKCFDMQLAMNIDWTIGGEGNKSSHLHYFQEFEDVELKWYLVQNKGSHDVLFNSKPLFDYFLLCSGDDIYGYFERAVKAMQENNRIDGVFPIRFSLVKQKDNFLGNIDVKSNKKYLESIHV
jgi:hypothetical protein